MPNCETVCLLALPAAEGREEISVSQGILRGNISSKLHEEVGVNELSTIPIGTCLQPEADVSNTFLSVRISAKADYLSEEIPMRRLTYILLLTIASLLAAACSKSEPPAPEAAKIVLVTGATGTQGGAVARELIDRGYAVRGLTRNPDSERATALSELGIDVVKGDFDDAASLNAAMEGVYGVFAVTNYWEHGFDREVAHGKGLIDAAQKAAIKHFIFTSVAGADGGTGLSHFDSKAEIEVYLVNSGLDHTILRPVEFLDNLRYARDDIMSGHFVDPRDASKSHQWIAARDIGFFVGEAFDYPDIWVGAAENIAGVQMTLAEFVAALSEVTGVDVQYGQIDWDDYQIAQGAELTEMVRWFDNEGYSVDVAGLRSRYPGLTTLRDYLLTEGWNER